MFSYSCEKNNVIFAIILCIENFVLNRFTNVLLLLEQISLPAALRVTWEDSIEHDGRVEEKVRQLQKKKAWRNPDLNGENG